MHAFIGQIQLFPYDFAPVGWALCDGRLLKVEEHQALYTLLNLRFGGDGKSTFGLPNLKGKEPAPNMRYCISLVGIYPERP